MSKSVNISFQEEWYPGKYKILVKYPGDIQGITEYTANTMESARHLIGSMADEYPDGSKLYIRYSNPKKRHISGYREPNQEGYYIKGGVPILSWRGRGESKKIYKEGKNLLLPYRRGSKLIRLLNNYILKEEGLEE